MSEDTTANRHDAAYFRALSEYATDLVAVITAEGVFQYVSPSYRRIFGYTPEDLIGTNGFERIHPDDIERVRAAFQDALAAEGAPVTAIFRFRHADGTWRVVEATGSNRLADPVVRGFIVNSRDITDRVRAEEERDALLLREQAARAAAEREHQRLQQVLDVLPEAILIADTSPRFVMANRAAIDIMGMDVVGHEVTLSDEAAFAAFGSRRRDGTPCPAADLPLQRALFRGEMVRGEQLLARNAATGRDIPVLANAAPIHNADGTIGGAVVVFQDITALHDLERMRDEFLSSAAHDLKAPLTTIRGNAQLAMLRLSHLNTPEAEQVVALLGRIDRATVQMQSLIADIIDVTRMHMGGTITLDRAPADLVALVRSAVEQQQTATPGTPISLDTPLATLEASVDRARLERVMANLLSNAVKYSPQRGPITVRIAREETPAGAYAVIAVQDQGIGIPAADLPYIFERFRRASNVIGRIQGTGIGLASARQIVEQHGGTISVESGEGQGSTFTIRLPLAQEPRSQPPQ